MVKGMATVFETKKFHFAQLYLHVVAQLSNMLVFHTQQLLKCCLMPEAVPSTISALSTKTGTVESKGLNRLPKLMRV